MVSTPQTQSPLNQRVVQAQAALTLSWEGVQAVQVLNPRQAVLTLGSEGAPAAQALIPRQAALIPLSWEVVQALIFRQARVSVLVKVPLALQQGMPLLPQTMQ